MRLWKSKGRRGGNGTAKKNGPNRKNATRQQNGVVGGRDAPQVGLTTDQYEYVRREFAYDYVPPSQYVPSQSYNTTDEDDIDGDDEEIEVEVHYGRGENDYYYSGTDGEEDYGYAVSSHRRNTDHYHSSPIPFSSPPKKQSRGRKNSGKNRVPVQPIPVQVIDPSSDLTSGAGAGASDVVDTDYRRHQPAPPPSSPRQPHRQQQQPQPRNAHSSHNHHDHNTTFKQTTRKSPPRITHRELNDVRDPPPEVNHIHHRHHLNPQSVEFEEDGTEAPVDYEDENVEDRTNTSELYQMKRKLLRPVHQQLRHDQQRRQKQQQQQSRLHAAREKNGDPPRDARPTPSNGTNRHVDNRDHQTYHVGGQKHYAVRRPATKSQNIGRDPSVQNHVVQPQHNATKRHDYRQQQEEERNPIRNGQKQLRSNNSRSAPPMREQQDTRDDPEYLREKRSFLDDELSEEQEQYHGGVPDASATGGGYYEDEDLQTADGYQSPDSAEGFVKEQSSRKRYNSTDPRRGHRGGYRLKNADPPRRQERESHLQTTVANDRRDDILNSNEYGDRAKADDGRKLRARNRQTMSGENVVIANKKLEADSRKKTDRRIKKLSNHHNTTQGQINQQKPQPHRQAPPPKQKRGWRKTPRKNQTREEEADRHIVHRVSSIEPDEFEIEHADSDPYYNHYEDVTTGNYPHDQDQDSYYATPSGLASDVKFIETSRIPADDKRKSKGLFEIIRDSVRDSVRGSSTTKPTDRRSKQDGRRSTRAAAAHPSRPAEPIPPSIQSEISYEHPHYPHDNYPKRNYRDVIVENTMEGTDPQETYNPQRRQGQQTHSTNNSRARHLSRAPPHDVMYDQNYMIDDYEKERVRKKLQDTPSGNHNGQYWDDEEEPRDDSVAASSVDDEYVPHQTTARKSPRQPPQLVLSEEAYEHFDSRSAPPSNKADHLGQHQQLHRVPVTRQSMPRQYQTNVPVDDRMARGTPRAAPEEDQHRRYPTNASTVQKKSPRQHPRKVPIVHGGEEAPSSVSPDRRHPHHHPRTPTQTVPQPDMRRNVAYHQHPHSNVPSPTAVYDDNHSPTDYGYYQYDQQHQFQLPPPQQQQQQQQYQYQQPPLRHHGAHNHIHQQYSPSYHQHPHNQQQQDLSPSPSRSLVDIAFRGPEDSLFERKGLSDLFKCV